MVQFNLLPDVKKDYIKTKRTKRVIATVAFLVTSAFVGVTVILFLFVRFAQTKNISDLTFDISDRTEEINSIEDLNKKLTVQNQLNILTPLHEGKPEASRLFEYVRFFSPETAELSELNIDMVNGQITISGSINTLAEANRLVDNIKTVSYGTYTIGEEPPTPLNQNAYTILDSSVSSDGEEARFEVEMEFNEELFDNTIEIVMQLKDRVITTSEVKEEE